MTVTTVTAGRPALESRFYLTLVWVGLATFVLHESAHWIAGRLVGLDVRFSLNGVTPIGPVTTAQHVAMSAAGPAVTIVQAIVAFVMLRARPGATALAFLIWAAFMRLVASGLSLVLPNDEARIGSLIGIGYWTLPVVVTLSLGMLAWIGARRFVWRWRDAALVYVVLSLTTAAIVFGDRALH